MPLFIALKCLGFRVRPSASVDALSQVELTELFKLLNTHDSFLGTKSQQHQYPGAGEQADND